MQTQEEPESTRSQNRFLALAFLFGAFLSLLRLRSLEREGRWDFRIHGAGAREFHLQASLSTLDTPFVPCAARWRGRRLPDDVWSYDEETSVLRAVLHGKGGRLTVLACEE